MPTVYSRIKFYCKRKKTFLLGQRDRIAIGKLIAEAYHQEKIDVPLKKVRSEEKEGVFYVLKYPLQFMEKMDAIISNFEHIPVEKRKRIRIPIKSPAVKVN